MPILLITIRKELGPTRWAIRTGGKGSVGLAIFEKVSNPHYPGDWIVYEKLPWFQPAFPAKGIRFALKKDNPLVLEYRLWIRPGGQATDQQYRAQWECLQHNHR